MIGLVLVELHRLFARRITLVAALLLIGLIGLLTIGILLLQLAFGDWDSPGEIGPTFGELCSNTLPLAAFFSMLSAYLLGASFIAAEYASGSLATWLTFVPSRLPVFFSKLVAAVIGSLAVGLLGLGLTIAVAVAFAGVGGGGLEGADEAGAMAGRILVVVGVAGVCGFCVASVTRNTGIAVGLVLGYLVCAYVFNFAMSVVDDLQWIQPWLPEQNVIAVILDGTSFSISRPGPNVTLELPFAQAVAYWIALVAVLVTATAALFRRRDVV